MKQKLIAQANKEYQSGNYRNAESLYVQVVRETPELASIAIFNASLCRYQLKLQKRKANGFENKFLMGQSFVIMTSMHTLFIATMIREVLVRFGCNVEIIFSVPSDFDSDFYIVLTPNIFKTLPPGEKRALFQMEQSVSSRWFTDEYIANLENSLAVLDYSIQNIKFLKTKGVAFPLVYYVPIGGSKMLLSSDQTCLPQNKDIDILFYGDSLSSPRRQKLLDIVGSKFNIKIVNNEFGESMHQLIKRSKMVLNLHYYEGALLETPRIMECLSLGTAVVSEFGSDMNRQPSFGDAVHFFEIGDESGMISAIQYVLANPPSFESIFSVVSKSEDDFSYMFIRFLVGVKILPAEAIDDVDLSFSKANKICLSMPETVDRYDKFLSANNGKFFMYNGFRRAPGWIGCGLSYQAIADYAIKNDLQRLTVVEDDVVLPVNDDLIFSSINKYLDHLSDDWDVFAGMIAHLKDDAKVLRVDEFDGLKFVTINRMTSTVCNIYNNSFLRKISRWNPKVEDPISNTIDRYIEGMPSLRVVVTLPFQFGHDEDVFSSLWNFQNSQYNEMIKNSESLLFSLVEKFEMEAMHMDA